MKKRPATYVPGAPSQYADEPEAPPTVHAEPRPGWVMPVPKPPCPVHVAHVLWQQGHMQQLGQRQAQLSHWFDCSGIKSEMFAWRERRPAMREAFCIDVQLNLYCTCDFGKKCLEMQALTANQHGRAKQCNSATSIPASIGVGQTMKIKTCRPRV